MAKTDRNTRKQPSWWAALIPLAVLVALLAMVIHFFGAASMDGGSQISLLAAAGVTVVIAMLCYHVEWSQMIKSISDNIRTIAEGIIILILIGAISGSWMISGIVPTLICYGLKILSPKIFLLAACLICAIVSLVTGSSWTTIATIGVALIGIGTAMGYSPGWTAGAIISGAYFGDKISPLSDTTVLASSCTGTPLFEHIRYMLVTTVPSITIACIVFLVASLLQPGNLPTQTQEFDSALRSSFNITPWVLLTPVLTGVLIAKRVPAIATLFLSALMAGITAVIAQPDIIASIGGSDEAAGTMFRGVMISFYGSTAVETGNAAVDSLVSTNGIGGMLNTIFLIICASVFGGTLEGSGMLSSLTAMFTRRLDGRTGMVATTVGTGVFADLVTGDQYLSIILASNICRKLFKDKGYESRLLSRSVEDSATVTSVLIPWNSCGMTQATVLRVATLDYLPYCIFNLVSPFMSILIAATGYKIIRKKND